MFVKPNDQLGSFGASLISSFDGEAATLHDGTRLNAGELVSQLFGRNAYLFQPVVSNHPDLSPLTQKLATIRLINFVSSDGVFTPFAILKIATGDNIADNFWRAGNMLAQLDVDTGKIVRVVKGTGLDQVVMNDHAGLQLPMWQDLRQLNEKVARIFAPVAFNSLDVAVTPEGPTVIEVNSGSSFDLWQVASGSGFLQPDVRAFLDSRGCFSSTKGKFKK